MFRKESRSWIALGDPVGRAEEAEELIWEYRKYCTKAGVKPVFYRVSKNYLELYMDLGLTFFKIGEEGRVSLSGSEELSLDRTVQKNCQELADEGYRWELIRPDQSASYMSRLKHISKESLRSQKRKEIGFAVGRFDEEYLQHFPIAVIKKEDRIVAFSNILQSGHKHELSTDLLRYRSEVPHTVIDFMIVQTMKWGAKQDYEWFNLGMAPLSGSNEHYYSPRWNKLANFVYTYGENMYGFKTVRSYKEKFHPEWEPKYLVCPAGLALPGILSNLSNVISGGFSSPVSGKLESYPLKKKKRQEK